MKVKTGMQAKNLEAGTEAIAMEEAAYWFAPPPPPRNGLPSLLSYTTREPLHWSGTVPSRLGPPTSVTSVINQENAIQTYLQATLVGLPLLRRL